MNTGLSLALYASKLSPANQEAIVQQVVAALGTPVFGRVDSANNIILSGELASGTYTLKYENEHGKTTMIGTLEHDANATAYTNQIPLSTDTDGTIYNGTGYKTATRWSDSSAKPTNVTNVNATTPAFFTGLIPVKRGDRIRLLNCWIDSNQISADYSPYGNQTWGLKVLTFAEDKTTIVGSAAWTDLPAIIWFENPVIDENGLVTGFDITNDGVFLRACLASNDPSQAVLTVNEEII